MFVEGRVGNHFDQSLLQLAEGERVSQRFAGTGLRAGLARTGSRRGWNRAATRLEPDLSEMEREEEARVRGDRDLAESSVRGMTR